MHHGEHACCVERVSVASARRRLPRRASGLLVDVRPRNPWRTARQAGAHERDAAEHERHGHVPAALIGALGAPGGDDLRQHRHQVQRERDQRDARRLARLPPPPRARRQRAPAHCPLRAVHLCPALPSPAPVHAVAAEPGKARRRSPERPPGGGGRPSSALQPCLPAVLTKMAGTRRRAARAPARAHGWCRR